MKKTIQLAILCIFILSLAACSSKTTTTSTKDSDTKKPAVEQSSAATYNITKPLVQGLWEVNDELYYFAEDGQFISFTNQNLAGGTWEFQSNELVLNLFDQALSKEEEIRLTGTVKGDDMTLVSQHGSKSMWEREDDKVRYVESELYYLQRIALPPEILLEINLTQNNGTRYLARSVNVKQGGIPIVFRTYYLEEHFLPNTPLEVEALVIHENSFLFTAEKDVTLGNTPQIEPILLVQPDPNKISELIGRLEAPQRELANTYWKLTELNGKEVYQNFDTEPHVIFHQTHASKIAGNANGNDGCNSFFSSWEVDNDNLNDLDIELGGSTMRLCNDDKLNQQTQDYLKALDETDNYFIQGSTLFLQDDNDTIATFEAVDL